MAEFSNVLVFSDIDKETDIETNKPTGRFIVNGYSIGYNNVELVSFFIDAEDAGVAKAIKKKMNPGNAIKTFGHIKVVNNIATVNEEEDDWGNKKTSPMEPRRVNGATNYEYVIYKVDGSTFDTETYTEEAISAAMKAVKASKEAEKKFANEEKAEKVEKKVKEEPVVDTEWVVDDDVPFDVDDDWD